MRQQTLASQASFEKYGRKTRRELFLEEMNQVVPWSELEALVEPHYPKAGNGRRPVGLGIMWKRRCMTQLRCGGLWAWILVWRLRPMRPASAGSATCWRSTSWAERCWMR
jgi:hypothetical protein